MRTQSCLQQICKKHLRSARLMCAVLGVQPAGVLSSPSGRPQVSLWRAGKGGGPTWAHAAGSATRAALWGHPPGHMPMLG